MPPKSHRLFRELCVRGYVSGMELVALTPDVAWSTIMELMDQNVLMFNADWSVSFASRPVRTYFSH